MICDYEPEIAEALLTGKVIMAQETVIKVSKLPPDDLRILRDSFREKDHERMQMPDIWHELCWNRVHISAPEKQKKVQAEAKIKQMPAFDPDAELSSLTLTIPSWKGSLDRILSVSDLSIATETAKNRLEEQLQGLSGSVDTLLNALRENRHEH